MVFDTETTGLPQTKILNRHTLHLFPHIVQLSYIIYNFETNNVEKIRDFIIKVPEGIFISKESVKLHGITNEISWNQGVNIDSALTEFFDDYANTDLLVAHNMSFDVDMIRAELLRLVEKDNESKKTLEQILYKGLYDIIVKASNLYCTMQESIELCNIEAVNKKGEKYIKFPKLVELHENLFSETPSNLHNSLNDVIITLKCFGILKYNKDVCEFNNEIRILYERLV